MRCFGHLLMTREKGHVEVRHLQFFAEKQNVGMLAPRLADRLCDASSNFSELNGLCFAQCPWAVTVMPPSRQNDPPRIDRCGVGDKIFSLVYGLAVGVVHLLADPATRNRRRIVPCTVQRFCAHFILLYMDLWSAE